MRKTIISSLLGILMAVTLTAQGSGLGVGLSTDGLAVKYWMGSSNALTVAWKFDTAIKVDYLFGMPDALNVTDAPTPVYYGLGAAIGMHDDSSDAEEDNTEFRLAMRGVLGVSYYLSSYPVDIFLEVVPKLGVIGKTDFDMGGALGVRYFF